MQSCPTFLSSSCNRYGSNLYFRETKGMHTPRKSYTIKGTPKLPHIPNFKKFNKTLVDSWPCIHLASHKKRVFTNRAFVPMIHLRTANALESSSSTPMTVTTHALTQNGSVITQCNTDSLHACSAYSCLQ